MDLIVTLIWFFICVIGGVLIAWLGVREWIVKTAVSGIFLVTFLSSLFQTITFNHHLFFVLAIPLALVWLWKDFLARIVNAMILKKMYEMKCS